MDKTTIRKVRRARRKRGIRKTVYGTAQRPRLTLYRSNKHTYAQIIDDLQGNTLIAASTVEPAHDGLSGNRDAAAAVGTRVAQRALEAGIGEVVFDRNGFLYHGRVKALADAAREAGLRF